MIGKEALQYARQLVAGLVLGIVIDATYSGRKLVAAPTFLVMAAITFACGIGASAAVFAIIDAAFAPLPFPNGQSLVQVLSAAPGQAVAPLVPVTALRFLRSQNISSKQSPSHMEQKV